MLLDIDLPALREARKEVPPGAVKGYVCASADCLPFTEAFDMAVFANSLHLLDDHGKRNSLAETRRVLHPGGVLAVNSAFYGGASPDESRPFYGRWIRRSIAEINQAMPHRLKSERAQATRSLPASGYTEPVLASGSWRYASAACCSARPPSGPSAATGTLPWVPFARQMRTPMRPREHCRPASVRPFATCR